MGKVSLPVILLTCFSVASFLSLEKMFGPAFKGLPFLLSILTLFAHFAYSLSKKKRLLRFDVSSVLLMLVFAVSALYTFVITVDYNNSLKIWTDFYKCIVFYFLISNLIRSKQELRFFLFSLVATAFYITYDFVQNPHWQNGRAYYTGSYVIGDPNGISLWVIVCLPLLWALILVSKSNILRLFYLFANLFYFRALFEAQSRGGFLGLLAIYVVSIFFIFKETKLSLKKRLLGIVLFSCLTAIVTTHYIPDQYIWRMQGIANPETDSTGSSQARLSAMSLAFNYMVRHPFSEYGLGNHSYYIVEQYGYDTISSTDDIFSGGNLAHNFLLQFGADTGLLPMMIYLIFIISIYVMLIKSKSKLSKQPTTSCETTYYVIASIVSLTGFIIGAFFLPWAYRIFLFYIAGVCSAVINIVEQEGEVDI